MKKKSRLDSDYRRFGVGTECIRRKPHYFCKKELPEGYLTAIPSQSNGVCSVRFPLVPIFLSVDSFSRGTVFYTIYYFLIGAVVMSYTAKDGYNTENL